MLLFAVLMFGSGSYIAAGVFRLALMRSATYDPYSPDACALALWDELTPSHRAAHRIATTAVVLSWPFWRLALLLPQQETRHGKKSHQGE